MRSIALTNQKGGVGKTTSTANLGACLAALGKRVLLIDTAPQANLSSHFGVDIYTESDSLYSLMIGEAPADKVITRTAVKQLDLIPSNINLAGAEIELVTMEDREFRLREALVRHLAAGRNTYYYILIDCPPSLGLLTLNALVAADAVLVPLQCEFYALEGLSQLMRTIERIRQAFNPDLEIQGVVLTMFDRRNNLSLAVAEDVREHFGDKVYRTVIPRNVRISEAPSHGLPVIVYDMRCSGSQAYIHLASEVMKRERSIAA